MTKANFTIWLFASLFVLACAPGERPVDPSKSRDDLNRSEHWSLTLEISGGIAGQMKVISLDQNGTAILTDKKTKSITEKVLSAQELQAYSHAIEAQPAASETVNRFSKCRDCFLYTLSITSDTHKSKITLDDTQLQSSGAKELIQMLATLASEMRKKN